MVCRTEDLVDVICMSKILDVVDCLIIAIQVDLAKVLQTMNDKDY